LLKAMKYKADHSYYLLHDFNNILAEAFADHCHQVSFLMKYLARQLDLFLACQDYDSTLVGFLRLMAKRYTEGFEDRWSTSLRKFDIQEFQC
jgi:hypothetical protein